MAWNFYFFFYNYKSFTFFRYHIVICISYGYSNYICASCFCNISESIICTKVLVFNDITIFLYCPCILKVLTSCITSPGNACAFILRTAFICSYILYFWKFNDFFFSINTYRLFYSIIVFLVSIPVEHHCSINSPWHCCSIFKG